MVALYYPIHFYLHNQHNHLFYYFIMWTYDRVHSTQSPGDSNSVSGHNTNIILPLTTGHSILSM